MQNNEWFSLLGLAILAPVCMEGNGDPSLIVPPGKGKIIGKLRLRSRNAETEGKGDQGPVPNPETAPEAISD